jgi:hypothetical protein
MIMVDDTFWTLIIFAIIVIIFVIIVDYYDKKSVKKNYTNEEHSIEKFIDTNVHPLFEKIESFFASIFAPNFRNRKLTGLNLVTIVITYILFLNNGEFFSFEDLFNTLYQFEPDYFFSNYGDRQDSVVYRPADFLTISLELLSSSMYIIIPVVLNLFFVLINIGNEEINKLINYGIEKYLLITVLFFISINLIFDLYFFYDSYGDNLIDYNQYQSAFIYTLFIGNISFIIISVCLYQVYKSIRKKIRLITRNNIIKDVSITPEEALRKINALDEALDRGLLSKDRYEYLKNEIKNRL